MTFTIDLDNLLQFWPAAVGAAVTASFLISRKMIKSMNLEKRQMAGFLLPLFMISLPLPLIGYLGNLFLGFLGTVAGCKGRFAKLNNISDYYGWGFITCFVGGITYCIIYFYTKGQ